jgi:hypothetical protein
VFSIKRWLERGGHGYKLVIQKLVKKEEVVDFFKEIFKNLDIVTGPRTRKDWAIFIHQGFSEWLKSKTEKKVLF